MDQPRAHAIEGNLPMVFGTIDVLPAFPMPSLVFLGQEQGMQRLALEGSRATMRRDGSTKKQGCMLACEHTGGGRTQEENRLPGDPTDVQAVVGGACDKLGHAAGAQPLARSAALLMLGCEALCREDIAWGVLCARGHRAWAGYGHCDTPTIAMSPASALMQCLLSASQQRHC
jgi:hypothetical protein